MKQTIYIKVSDEIDKKIREEAEKEFRTITGYFLNVLNFYWKHKDEQEGKGEH